MAPGQQSSARPPPPLGLVGLRASPYAPPLGQRDVVRSVVTPANPVRRVGLSRPHGSSLVGGIGSVFSSGSAGAGSSSGRRARDEASSSQNGTGAGSRTGNGTGGGKANGTGGVIGNGSGNERKRRRTAQRVVTAPVSLKLGAGFHIDTTSAFFELNTDVEASSNNPSDVGYRGIGYNPNFENADEYPPSQEHRQANQAPSIDLNALANKTTRRQYSTDEKRQIYDWIMQRNGPSRTMKRGVTAAVAQMAKCPVRVVRRIWRQGLNGGGINSVKCDRQLKCGRKKKNLNIEALEAIPTTERTTLRQVAAAMDMPLSTVFQRLKEKQMRRVTSELKPMLTEANMKSRVSYSLNNVEPSTLHDDPTFNGGYMVSHLDEKWFHRIRRKENVYLSNREEAPKRETKNKGHIEKIMFLSAMARPRYDAEGNCIFDGKIGVWAYVEWVQALKTSDNRKKGAWEIKPCTEVDRAKSREYLLNFVLPAIKAKWPASDRGKTIYIQQDNARTHVQHGDQAFEAEAAKGGWDIRMMFQPANSPDTNVLDLGWFASIQAMFAKKMPKNLAEILAKVNQSLAEYPHEKLNRIFLSHQACMREIIRRKGSIHYDVPHLKKKVLEREGRLPIRLKVEKEYVEEAIAWLNSSPT